MGGWRIFFLLFWLGLGLSACSTLQVQPVGSGDGTPRSPVETETKDCLFRAQLQGQDKGALAFNVEIKNLSVASWPIGPNRIFLSGAGVHQRVISAVDSDFEIAQRKRVLGESRSELTAMKAIRGRELMTGLMPEKGEKSERAKDVERERLALRDQLERRVSFLEIEIAEIERSRLFKSVLAPQRSARGRVDFSASVAEGDLLLTAECHRTSAVLRFRVVKK